NDQIATREMFNAPRFRRRHGDVNCGGYGGDIRCGANAIGIVDAVLQTHHCRIRREKRSHLFCGGRSIVCFEAKKNQRAILNRAHLDTCLDRDSLLALRFVENKAFRINCVSEMLSPDENSRRARACEHSAKITSYRTRAYHCNSRPIWSFAH